MAKEATEALKQAFYDHGVQETEIRLAEELVEVRKTIAKRYGRKCSIEQKSLLPPSGGLLRTYSTQRKSEKFQRCSLLPLFLPFPPRSSPPPPRPLFLLLRWLKARRLARGGLNSRIRARVKRSKPCQKPKVKRLPSRSRMLTPRPRMLLPRLRILTPRPRTLLLRITLPTLRHSFRILFSFCSYSFVLAVCHYL